MLDPLGAGSFAMTTRTDADGRFEARGLRSGSYQLWVRLAEGDDAESSRPVERRLKPGEHVQVDIGVPEGGRRVHGTVRLATGTPAGRAGPGCTITGSAGRATGCWIARPLDRPAAGAAVATGGMVSDGGGRVLTPTAEERAPGGGGSASLVTAARGAAAI